MSIKSNSNKSDKNITDLKEQINHLSLNLNPQETNSNKSSLKNVYNNINNITSPKSSITQKLSEFEEKMNSINLENNNIDNYYKSLKEENQGIIPQMRRMELLQRKMNLLQNTNEQNSKALKEILEIEMKERLRYPKYTIIQNTPLTPHEEIMNQILQKKLGPGASYSMNYPTVVFKNQEEINEMRNIQAKNNENNIINNNNNYNRVQYQSNDRKPVTVKMIKEIQKEILGLRKTVNDFKVQLKEMKEKFKNELENDINSNKLLIEIIRKVIEEGGDNKLKSSVEKNFDKKKINLDEIKTDLEIFKTEELNDIINEEINKYDKKMNKILEKMKNDLQKIMNNNNVNNNINNNNENNDKNYFSIINNNKDNKKAKKSFDFSPEQKNKKDEINNFINTNKILPKQQSTINYYNESIENHYYINNNLKNKTKNKKVIKNYEHDRTNEKNKSDNFYSVNEINKNLETESNIKNEKELIINKRIKYFKERSIKALGNNFYNKAYNYLKKMKNNNSINNETKREYLSDTFGKNNIGYWQLIDQILILENILETS